MCSAIETQESCPDFSRLKTELLNNSQGVTLYNDPIFQPRFSILFNRQSKIDFYPSEIMWHRPNQLCKRPCLVSSKGLEGVRALRGHLTPQWFPVLFALLRERNLLNMVIPNFYSQNTFNQNYMIFIPNTLSYCGAFQFQFRRGGVTEDVVIDDRLPTTLNCHLLTAISENVDEFLPALLEKAYAKFIGGYYNLEKQDFLTALMDFTGGLVESISMKGNELLTITELESFYGKLTSLVGESFVICQIKGETNAEKKSNSSSDICIINGITQIPVKPPDGVVDYFLNSMDDNSRQLIPVIRMFSFLGIDTYNSIINERCLNEKWDNCSEIIKRNYGIIWNDRREKWVPVEELPYFCDRVVIVHLFYRNSIMALAKKQLYWNFSFFESFWLRDGPRGDIEYNQDLFLKNTQYICIVQNEDGCNIKVVLTVTQKYVDSGANVIKRLLDVITGITILEVERNRQYKLHNLKDTRIIQSHIDSRIDRVLIISATLEIGSYVIIPWISAGVGTRYTLQFFSSELTTDFKLLKLDCPVHQICFRCKIKQNILQARRTVISIYEKQTTLLKRKNSIRKISSIESDLCSVCQTIYPKRATKMSVLHIEVLETLNSYKFPALFFIINCEDEKHKSRTVQSTLSPCWNEHFIFYRNSPSTSNVKIEIFVVGTFGFSSSIANYLFSEKELRDDGHVNINVCLPTIKENIRTNCKLLVDIKNYLPSEFCIV